MDRLYTLLIFLIGSVCLNTVGAQIPVTPNGVTVTSDTTDTDEADSAVWVASSGSNGRTVVFDGEDVTDFFGMLRTMLAFLGGSGGVGGLLLLVLVATLLFVLAPIGLIVLVLWLLLRRRRHASVAPETGPEVVASTMGITRGVIPSDEKKEKAVLHIAVGVGICIALYILGSRLGAAVGIIVTCYGVGEYVNALRCARKERKD